MDEGIKDVIEENENKASEFYNEYIDEMFYEEEEGERDIKENNDDKISVEIKEITIGK